MAKAEYSESDTTRNKLLKQANKKGRESFQKMSSPKDQLALMDSLINISELANRK